MGVQKITLLLILLIYLDEWESAVCLWRRTDCLLADLPTHSLPITAPPIP